MQRPPVMSLALLAADQHYDWCSGNIHTKVLAGMRAGQWLSPLCLAGPPCRVFIGWFLAIKPADVRLCQ
jgi:hypothetical protein